MKKLLLIVLACLPFSAYSADYIGVTAAMSGEVKRTASTIGASIGALKSGSKIFEGDKLNVSDDGRLQVMLRDQTTFTLGSGAEMVIDQYVAGSNGKISADINRGVFRFVSGLIAKNSADALKVKLPHATIGVRGTQVAGEVANNGSSDIVLIGPGPNSFGATPGAITIENDFGSVDVTRAGYAVSIDPVQAPSEPVIAPPALIQRLERAVQELAGEEVAAAVIAENASPEVLALAEALVNSGARGDDATNDQAVLDVIFSATNTEGAADLDSINFTGEAAYLIVTAFGGTDLTNPPEGPSPSDIQGLSGSYRYTANNVQMTLLSESNSGLVTYPSDNSASGTFDSVTTWDFGGGTLTSQIDGSVANLPTDATNTVSFNFAYTGTESLSSINTVAALSPPSTSTDTSASSVWATEAIALTSATASVTGTGDALNAVAYNAAVDASTTPLPTAPSCSSGVSCGSTQTGTLTLSNIQNSTSDTSDSLFFATNSGIITAVNTGDVGFTNATFTTEDSGTFNNPDGTDNTGDEITPNLGGTGVAAAQAAN